MADLPSPSMDSALQPWPRIRNGDAAFRNARDSGTYAQITRVSVINLMSLCRSQFLSNERSCRHSQTGPVTVQPLEAGNCQPRVEYVYALSFAQYMVLEVSTLKYACLRRATAKGSCYPEEFHQGPASLQGK